MNIYAYAYSDVRKTVLQHVVISLHGIKKNKQLVNLEVWVLKLSWKHVMMFTSIRKFILAL